MTIAHLHCALDLLPFNVKFRIVAKVDGPIRVFVGIVVRKKIKLRGRGNLVVGQFSLVETMLVSFDNNAVVAQLSYNRRVLDQRHRVCAARFREDR